jgi:hypothetical protein
MARQSVGQILQNISATVNQDPTQPTDGGADFLLWLNFINRAQVEWAEAFDWEQLKKTHLTSLVIPSGGSIASIGLPLDFRKLSGPVINWSTGVTGGEGWPEILPERLMMQGTTDKFFFAQGDPSGGYNLQWYPGSTTNVGASGATISITYYSMPTSLVSSTQYPITPDSEFIAQRTIAYVLEARSDPRYQDEERKARERLLTMIENASVAKYESYVSPTKILTPENRQGFRLGRN